MTYENIRPAVFLNRPNRFIANIEMDGQQKVCHVKNTGRCKEILVPGAHVFVQEVASAKRKTAYDLISVQKGERLINIDSNAPNKVFHQWVQEGRFLPSIELIKPECSYGNSRFDFFIISDGRPTFVEVKGVTLEDNCIVRFPDAPTLRGVKHLNELTRCVQEGYDAWVVFIIQMHSVCCFEPNWETHPDFGQALRAAKEKGVNLLALDCKVTENSIEANKPVELRI